MHLACDHPDDPHHRKLLSGLDLQFYLFYLSQIWQWLGTMLHELRRDRVIPWHTSFMVHVVYHVMATIMGWLVWKREFSTAWFYVVLACLARMITHADHVCALLLPRSRLDMGFTRWFSRFQVVLSMFALLPEAIDALLLTGSHCGTSLSCVACAATTYVVLWLHMIGVASDTNLSTEEPSRTKAS